MDMAYLSCVNTPTGCWCQLIQTGTRRIRITLFERQCPGTKLSEDHRPPCRVDERTSSVLARASSTACPSRGASQDRRCLHPPSSREPALLNPGRALAFARASLVSFFAEQIALIQKIPDTGHFEPSIL